MKRVGWGADIDGSGWTVVNRPQLQRWFVPYSLLSGFVVIMGIRRILTAPADSTSWGPGLVAILLGSGLFVILWLNMWRGLAIFAFGPDRLLVRTWIGNMLGRPPRVFMLTPDLKIVFRLIWGLTIDAPSQRFVTNGQYVPSTEMRKLIAVAEQRGIPIEYGWKPEYMLPRKPRWQRWLGL